MSATLDPAHSVTLLASAGTGKTWALTARIVRLLLAGAEPGSILALTFTRKAAGEMQSRVAARLQALAYASEAELGRLLREIGADDDAATRQRARGLFEAALYADTPLRASTLHVFCAEVLGRFALEAEVPAGFTLVENERALRGEAIEAVLRHAHRDPQSPAAQALDSLADEGLSEFEVRGLLRSLFEHRAELWAATEGEAEPLASLCAALAAALPWDSAAAPCEQLDAPGFSFRLKAFYGLLRDSQDSQYVKHAALEPALVASGDERLRALLAALYKKDRSGPYALKLSKRFSDAQAGAVRHHHAALLEALVLVADQQRSAATYRRSRAALTLGLAVLEAFALGLQRSHQLGFAELEWQTVRLLRRAGSAEWVRYKLDRQLEHVLLDEFQDTSPTQWRLLLPLLEEFVSRRDSARTVFLVGDGKQSIYGFRRAEPALLGIAGDWLTAALAAKSESLHESRRSAPAVIDFVNALFGGDAGEQIGFAPHRTALGELCGQVEVAPLIQPADRSTAANDAALRNPLTTPREVDEDRRAAEEAQWVVDRIRQLMDQRLVITARDGEHRALRWDDVMVLARHRTHLGILEKTLGIEGIPYSSATRSTLLVTPVAQDLLALLGVLDSPHRDLALAQALRSPLFSVSDDALLWLADAARASGQSWFAALGNADAPDVLADAGERLREWRTLAQTLPPHDLIDRIASESDLLRRSRAARPHDTLLAGNLSALLQLALDTDHGRYPTLGGFLRHCQQLGDGDGPDEAPPAAGEARLRVMTVHAAKGLEAAVVFLVNSAPTPRPAQAGWRVDWPAAAERPVVVVHAGKVEQREPLSRTLLEAAQRREQREDLNLLYVAVTRARQYLFVSGFQSGRAVQAESWHARCRAALASLSPVTTTSPTALWSHASGALPLLGAATPESGPATPLNPRLLMPLPRADAAGVNQQARDPEAVLHGQTVHAVLQHLASDAALSDEALLARVQQQLGLRPAAALWAHALAEARQVRAAPALSRFFDGHGQSWNEVPLHIETAAGIEISVLDRLVDTDEALWVIDYKTSRRPAAEVLAAAEAQLRRYVAAVQRLFPARAVRGAVISTPTATLLILT